MLQSPFSPFIGRRATRKDFKRRQSQLPSDLIDWDAPEIPEVEKDRIIYEELLKECQEDHTIECLINDEIHKVVAETYIEQLEEKLHRERSQAEEELLKERSQKNLLLGQFKMFERHCQELESHSKQVAQDKENLAQDLEQQRSRSQAVIEELKQNLKDVEQQLSQSQHQMQEFKQKSTDLEQQCSQLQVQNQDFEQKWTEADEAAKAADEEMKELRSELENLKIQLDELKEQNIELIEQHNEQIKEYEFRIKEVETELSCQVESFLNKKSEADDFKRKWESTKNQLSYYKKLAKGEQK